MMDLKACPFCGNPHPDPKGGFEWVRCSVCTATADDTKTWNTRPREDALQAEVDALKLALTKAERQFEFYANEHYRAGKYDKEKTNRDMANMLRAALKGAPHD